MRKQRLRVVRTLGKVPEIPSNRTGLSPNPTGKELMPRWLELSLD